MRSTVQNVHRTRRNKQSREASSSKSVRQARLGVANEIRQRSSALALCLGHDQIHSSRPMAPNIRPTMKLVAFLLAIANNFVSAQNPACNICPEDEEVTSPVKILPQGYAGFLPVDTSCFEIEEMAQNGDNNIIQCDLLSFADVEISCGCGPSTGFPPSRSLQENSTETNAPTAVSSLQENSTETNAPTAAAFDFPTSINPPFFSETNAPSDVMAIPTAEPFVTVTSAPTDAAMPFPKIPPNPTSTMTNMPTRAGVIVQETFSGVSISFVGANKMNFREVTIFETITEEWFTK